MVVDHQCSTSADIFCLICVSLDELPPPQTPLRLQSVFVGPGISPGPLLTGKIAFFCLLSHNAAAFSYVSGRPNNTNCPHVNVYCSIHNIMVTIIFHHFFLLGKCWTPPPTPRGGGLGVQPQPRCQPNPLLVLGSSPPGGHSGNHCPLLG